MLIVRFADTPPAPAGMHYRLFFVGTIPPIDLNNLPTCSFSAVRDWVNPSTGSTFISYYSDGGGYSWCPGPASVTLNQVPDASPRGFSGTVTATVSFTVS